MPLRSLALRRVACFAMLAMLLHAFAPFAHAWSGRMQADAGVPFSPFGSICTTLGAASAQPVDNTFVDNAPATPTADLSRFCPLCLAGAQVALAADVPEAFRADSALQHVRAAFVPHVVVLPAAQPPFSPRAPPRV